MSLFDTLVVKKLTAISKSGLDLFIINDNFTITEWNNSTLLSLSCLVSFLTSNNLLVAGDVTSILKNSLNIYMHYYDCSSISTCMMFSLISIFVQKKVYLLPLTTDTYPNFFFTSFMISNIISGFYAITCCHPHTKQWYIV